MKINELIKKLQAVKKKHGDIEVMFPVEQIDGYATMNYREKILDNDYWGFDDSMEQRHIESEGYMSDGSVLSDIELGEVDTTWTDDGEGNEIEYLSIKGSFFEFMDKQKEESDKEVFDDNFKSTFKLPKKQKLTKVISNV